MPSITVFDKNNLRVQFALECDPTDPLLLSIMLTATNGSAVAIQDFVFQAAVPKVRARLSSLTDILVAPDTEMCCSCCLCILVLKGRGKLEVSLALFVRRKLWNVTGENLTESYRNAKCGSQF